MAADLNEREWVRGPHDAIETTWDAESRCYLARWVAWPSAMLDGESRNEAIAKVIDMTPTYMAVLADIPRADVRDSAETAKHIALRVEGLVDKLSDRLAALEAERGRASEAERGEECGVGRPGTGSLITCGLPHGHQGAHQREDGRGGRTMWSAVGHGFDNPPPAQPSPGPSGIGEEPPIEVADETLAEWLRATAVYNRSHNLSAWDARLLNAVADRLRAGGRAERCTATMERDGETLRCEEPAGHEDNHRQRMTHAAHAWKCWPNVGGRAEQQRAEPAAWMVEWQHGHEWFSNSRDVHRVHANAIKRARSMAGTSRVVPLCRTPQETLRSDGEEIRQSKPYVDSLAASPDSAPPVVAPEAEGERPTHTDLMVTPESLDVFLHAPEETK